jgi:hypothetical protein
VISDDLHGRWGASQKGEPFFEGLDDCEKFFVINLIINLSWGMLLREISHRVENINIIIL